MTPTTFTTNDLKAWLETETGSILNPVQAQAQKYSDETQTALQNLSDASKMLFDNSQKEIEKRNAKVYNRARALNKLANIFMERIKKLKAPEQISFDNFSVFASETQKTLTVIEIDIKNWFPRISPFFIMDRRKFLTTYEKTKMTVNSLTDFVNKDYIKSKTLEKTYQLIDELQSFEEQIAAIEAEQANLQNERLLLEKEIDALQQRATQVKGNDTLKELNRLDAEVDALSDELKQTLRHLQKPFLKMQALATFGGGGGITPDELKMIGLYMDNPFEAIVAEQAGCPVLNQILEKLLDLMAENKLKLKSDKKRKAKQDVDEILKSDTLTDLHKRCVEVFTLKEKLLTSKEMEEATQHLSLLKEQMETLRIRRDSIEADEKMKENQRQDLLDRARHLKSSVEANVLSFMGRQVQLQ
ncbi:MAG: hypothetical protein NWF00_00135 [Candidatus Bathyarchaeota archaeon]|nr:hypothetical protein [Candidatus Bathyarchaeota archaeon]